MPKKKMNVFISHSSTNKEIAEQLCVFLTQLGVKQKHIFCSSIIGNGVDNGEKLGDAIQKAISKSSLLIFLLSDEFINSSYCMEELGIGWYLSQQKQAKCYYLILPNLELSELQGFVNSKIDKFSFIDDAKRDELNLFVENICATLGLKQPKPSAMANYQSVFYSAVRYHLESLLDEKEMRREDERVKERIIEQQIDEIDRLERLLHDCKQEDKLRTKQIQLNTLEDAFYLLGLSDGLSQAQYSAFVETYWFSIVKKYENLLEGLSIAPDNEDMELLVASIYSRAGMDEQALKHLKDYIKLFNREISTYRLKNVLENYHGSLQEVIQILREKATSTTDAISKKQYLETAAKLEKKK